MRVSVSVEGKVRRVVFTAVKDPVNVFVAAASVIATPVFGSLWILLVGLAFCAACVAWKVSDPLYWQRVLAVESRMLLPEASRVTDPALQTVLSSLRAARSEVARVLAETGPEVHAQVRFALATLDDLERDAGRLVEQAEELSRYLRSTSRDQVQREVHRLDDLIARSADEEAQRQYRHARVIRLEQLAALDDVTRAHERVMASLHRVVAMIDGLPSRIVRVRVLHTQAREDLPRDIEEQLERMSGELRTSEHALAALAGDRGGNALLALGDARADVAAER